MKSLLMGIGGTLLGVVVGVVGACKKMEGLIERKQQMSEKHLELFLMMNQWVKVKQEEKSIVEFFLKKGYKRVAVYGMSYVGERLVDELQSTEIQVLYGIDQQEKGAYHGVDVVSLGGEMKEVDVVIVTAISYFEEIEEKLKNSYKCPIVSLENVLYEA